MHLVLAIPASAAGQSLDLGSYALFAQQLRSKGLVVTAGNVGGNLGLLHVSGGLDAPNSRVASDRAELQTASTCSELFTNDLKGSDPGCGPAVPAVFPLFPDLATECGFPDPFPACDPGAPVDVPDGQSLSLAPGTYGDVIVRGPPGATLTLDGDYVFCSLRVSRDAGSSPPAPRIPPYFPRWRWPPGCTPTARRPLSPGGLGFSVEDSQDTNIALRSMPQAVKFLVRQLDRVLRRRQESHTLGVEPVQSPATRLVQGPHSYPRVLGADS